MVPRGPGSAKCHRCRQPHAVMDAVGPARFREYRCGPDARGGQTQGILGALRHPRVGPLAKPACHLRPPLKSPTAKRLSSGEAAMPMGISRCRLFCAERHRGSAGRRHPSGRSSRPRARFRKGRRRTSSKRVEIVPTSGCIAEGPELFRLRVINQDAAMPRGQIELAFVPAGILRLTSLSQLTRRIAIERRDQPALRCEGTKPIRSRTRYRMRRPRGAGPEAYCRDQRMFTIGPMRPVMAASPGDCRRAGCLSSCRTLTG